MKDSKTDTEAQPISQPSSTGFMCCLHTSPDCAVYRADLTTQSTATKIVHPSVSSGQDLVLVADVTRRTTALSMSLPEDDGSNWEELTSGSHCSFNILLAAFDALSLSTAIL